MVLMSKVLSKYQITLPKKAVRELRIEKGDILKCTVERGRISFSPVVMEELYSDDELKAFDRLYNNPRNKGKVYRTRAGAMEHLKRLQ